MTKSFLRLALIATAFTGMSLVPAMAQNTLVGPGDLMLTLQNPGGTVNPSYSMIINLGATSSVFRDAAANSVTNLININTQLNANFGASGAWANTVTLWAGAINNRGTSDSSNTLLTLDPHRTIYTTQARTTLGTPGTTSTSFSISSGNANTVSANAATINNALETIGSNTTTGLFTSAGAVATQNPVNQTFNTQESAYSQISQGVQSNFGAGNLGTFGSISNVEVALDLFRVQFRNDISGQYGFGAPLQTGQYIGTITIDNAGQVAFTAVPEPSTYALLALGVGVIFFAMRRRVAKSVA